MDVVGGFEDVSLIFNMETLTVLGMKFHLPVDLPATAEANQGLC